MECKIRNNARYAVIGYGSWATAIVKLLTTNLEHVGWYIRNAEVLESLKTTGRNPKYLSDVEFDIERIAPSDDLNSVVAEADVIVMACPSAYLKKFLEPLSVSLEDKFIISAIKGIVPDDYTTVVEYIHDHYGLSFNQMGLLIGPSHAEEVARERLTYLTVVSPQEEMAHELGKLSAAVWVRTSLTRPSLPEPSC